MSAETHLASKNNSLQKRMKKIVLIEFELLQFGTIIKFLTNLLLFQFFIIINEVIFTFQDNKPVIVLFSNSSKR